MSAPSGRTPVRLALSEDAFGPAEAAPWIGPLVALGSRASRYVGKLSGHQLIVAISVPQRDFAAALVGCGWVLSSPAPQLRAPLDTLRVLEPNTPVRVVTEREVIADYFTRLNEDTDPPRVQLGRWQWQVPKIKAVAKLSALQEPVRAPRPSAGSIARLARLEATWNERLAAPAADLAIVGTLKWLLEDFAAFLTKEGESMMPDAVTDFIRKAQADGKTMQRGPGSDSIAGLLLPEGRKVATWFTRLYPSSRLAEQLPLPEDIRCAILDGAGAIKYLVEIEAEVVICILDRSVADETAGEIVVQLRNSRGEPLSVMEDLCWRPPAGVEALAFTVAL